jgi:transposase
VKLAQINQELDGERKKEQRKIAAEIKQEKILEQQAVKATILAGITDSKYAILKNEKDLSDEQKDKLAQVRNVSTRLGKMHQLKEDFREIFEKKENWAKGCSPANMG